MKTPFGLSTAVRSRRFRRSAPHSGTAQLYSPRLSGPPARCGSSPPPRTADVSCVGSPLRSSPLFLLYPFVASFARRPQGAREQARRAVPVASQGLRRRAASRRSNGCLTSASSGPLGARALATADPHEWRRVKRSSGIPCAGSPETQTFYGQCLKIVVTAWLPGWRRDKDEAEGRHRWSSSSRTGPVGPVGARPGTAATGAASRSLLQECRSPRARSAGWTLAFPG